jgi:hypothetical protein
MGDGQHIGGCEVALCHRTGVWLNSGCTDTIPQTGFILQSQFKAGACDLRDIDKLMRRETLADGPGLQVKGPRMRFEGDMISVTAFLEQHEHHIVTAVLHMVIRSFGFAKIPQKAKLCLYKFLDSCQSP